VRFHPYKSITDEHMRAPQCCALIDDPTFDWSQIQLYLDEYAPVLNGDDFDAAAAAIMQIPTPNFGEIMKYQGFSYETQRAVYFLFGRMFHPVRSADNFQVCLFLYGQPGTGKSTMLNLLSKMIGGGRIGIVDSNMEEKFGWQNLYNMAALICHEITNNCAIHQSNCNNTVSGDPQSIAIKNQGTQQRVVKGQLAMAGNDQPLLLRNFAAHRRTVRICFTRTVHNKKGNMDDLLSREQGNLLVKSQMMYALFVKFFGNHGIWDNYTTFEEDGGEVERPILGNQILDWHLDVAL